MERFRLWLSAAGCAAALLAAPAFAIDSGNPTDQENPVGEPAAQASDFYSAFNPLTKQIVTQLVVSDGRSMTIVVDRATNNVYLSDSTGATASIGIPQLATAYSQGDPARYAAFMDAMQRNLNATTVLETIAKRPGYALSPPNGLVSPCDMQPCGVLQRRFVDGHLESIFRWDVENVDYSYENFYTQDEIEEDRGDFEVWQNGQCNAADDEANDALHGYIIGTLGCAAAESVIGVGICISGFGGALNDSNQSDIARRNCRMQYPGPRRWAR